MNIVQQEFDPEVPIDKISEHPNNPRRGDDAVVAQSIKHNGWFGAVLIQRSTGWVIAGNTRFRVLRDQGAKTIPAFWLDVDDATAKKIMLVDNRSSDLAFYDDTELFGLLQQLVESDGGAGLEAAGYDRAAYELLLQSIESDTIIGGIRQGLTPDDRLDAYNELDVRSIILPYGPNDYETVAGGLSKLRERFGLQTNAEVVQRLVADVLTAV
jgi:hypothetical protein